MTDRLGRERDRPDPLAGRGRELLGVDVDLVLDDVGRREHAVGLTVYPVANRSRPGMIERAACRNEPSSKWPDVQFHGNCHQSRTPHEWSRWPAQSTAIVSSPTVTVPVTHDEIS